MAPVIVAVGGSGAKVPNRLYDVEAFDVVAACLFPQTKQWGFRFKRVAHLERYPGHDDKLHNFHVIDDTWQGDFPRP